MQQNAFNEVERISLNETINNVKIPFAIPHHDFPFAFLSAIFSCLLLLFSENNPEIFTRALDS